MKAFSSVDANKTGTIQPYIAEVDQLRMLHAVLQSSSGSDE